MIECQLLVMFSVYIGEETDHLYAVHAELHMCCEPSVGAEVTELSGCVFRVILIPQTFSNGPRRRVLP